MEKNKKTTIGTLAVPYAGTTRTAMQLSQSIAREIVAQFGTMGTFSTPVLQFNELIGLCDSVARSWQIKNYLNKNHGTVLPVGKEFAVGQKNKNTIYTFTIRPKTEKN
jgi:hypothetical protein